MKADALFARAPNLAAALSIAFAVTLSAVADARAEALADVLPDLVKISKKMKAAEADVGAAREKAREALGDWFPKLDLTGSYGYERQLKGNNTADTSIPPREFDMKITQLLWDFGSANRSIDNARLTFAQSQAARASIEQTVLLEGIVAYLDLMRRTKILEFSRGSEDNVKRQSELEDARVQRGSGFSTDVLQSKRQLASTQAARVRAEGALQVARNRYLNIYDKLPDNVATMAMPRLPIDLLPPTLNDVVDIAGKENPQLKAAKMTTDIARNNVSKTISDKFAPTVNLVGEHSHKNDFDGTLGTKNDRLVKVEGKYSFNLGFTAINTLKASSFTLTSTENKYGETLDNVLEQARNAWQEFDTSKQNLEHLRNEANIAAEFLELARKERALGRRSLIDVLAGETALINASSDAASAETDMAISVFKLLSAMGRLDLGTALSEPAPSRGQANDSTTASIAPDAAPVRAKAAEIVAAARASAAAKSAAASAAIPPASGQQTESTAALAPQAAPDALKWEAPPAIAPAVSEAPPAPANVAPGVPAVSEAPPVLAKVASAAPAPRAKKPAASAIAAVSPVGGQQTESPALRVETQFASDIAALASPAAPAANESSRQKFNSGGDSPAAPKAESPPAVAPLGAHSHDASEAPPAPAKVASTAPAVSDAPPVLAKAAPAPRAKTPSVSVLVSPVPEKAPATPAVATKAKESSVLYAIQNIDLRADISVVSPAVHMLNRCDPVEYIDGRLGWLRVRAPSSVPGGVVEGWVFGQFVSERRAECEFKWSAR